MWHVCCRWVSKIIGWPEWSSYFLLSLQGEPSESHPSLGSDDAVVPKAAVLWSGTFLRDGLIKSSRRRFRMTCIWNNLWITLWMDQGSCEEPPLGSRHSRICLNWTLRHVLKFKESCYKAPVDSEIWKLIYKIRNSTSQPRFHLSF